MRDKHYAIKTIRMDDTTWETLKKHREDSGLSWSLFIKLLIKLYEKSKNKQ